MNKYKFIVLIAVILLGISCSNTEITDFTIVNKTITIKPDYTNIVLPPNIAPLNFELPNLKSKWQVEIKSLVGEKIILQTSSGKVDIPLNDWKKLLVLNKGNKLTISIFKQLETGKWLKYNDIINKIAVEEIDSYLVYRLLYPGYELWNEMGIYQRDLSSFDESAIVENKYLKNSCVNCHSFSDNSPDKMMFHIRGKCSGTMIYVDGKLEKLNIKNKQMKNGAVYPSWHPNGKIIAFSSNKIMQFFHSKDNKYIEVSDSESDIIIYNVKSKKIILDSTLVTKKYLETFPSWSHDGKYLYYTRTDILKQPINIKDIHYDLVRVRFYENDYTFGKPEVLFDAKSIGKSVSFPRISPDNNYLIFTLSDYGNFSIWHTEADLYIINLKTNITEMLPVNSSSVESYHSWSSNGRWFVFSSKRRDNQCAIPYFSYFDENGKASKPFILPQKNPTFYNNFLKTYNIPEFITGKVNIDKWDIIDKATE